MYEQDFRIYKSSFILLAPPFTKIYFQKQVDKKACAATTTIAAALPPNGESGLYVKDFSA